MEHKFAANNPVSADSNLWLRFWRRFPVAGLTPSGAGPIQPAGDPNKVAASMRNPFNKQFLGEFQRKPADSPASLSDGVILGLGEGKGCGIHTSVERKTVRHDAGPRTGQCDRDHGNRAAGVQASDRKRDGDRRI